jgi:two-component system chemotaxis response regulator CheB
MIPPVIAIGGSAGGIEALRAFLPKLPAHFPAAIAVVLHRLPVEEDDRLVRVLEKNVVLPVAHAEDGMPVLPGRVVVCPAGVHLRVEGRRYTLDVGAHENRFRPAIDVLFRSVARSHGQRGVGVVLSGLLDDGTAGLAAIVAHGGRSIVQDPDDAQYGDMPRNALENVRVDAVCRASDIADRLAADIRRIAGVADGETARLSNDETTEASLFSCPACGGVLSEVDAYGVVRYRCRTGHAYSPRTLFAEQEDVLEDALWIALRALVERRDLSERLARRARAAGRELSAHHFDEQAALAENRQRIVREALGGPIEVLREAAVATDPIAATDVPPAGRREA